MTTGYVRSVRGCVLCELREWIADHDPEHWRLEDTVGPHRKDIGMADPFGGIP